MTISETMLASAPAATPAPRRLHLSQRDRLLILGFWLLFGLLETTGAYATSRLGPGGAPMPLDSALLGNLPWWLLWGGLTPIVFWLAERFRFDGTHWGRFALVHFPLALITSAIHIVIAGAIFYYGTRSYYVSAFPAMVDFRLMDLYERWSQTYLIIDIIVYWAIVGAYHAFDYNHRFRQGQLSQANLAARAAQLESRVTEARLAALRMELNPHFLFNTLNAISGLVRRGEHGSAVTMLARLGDLLRATLERGGEQTVPLEKELEYLNRYLEIEQVRFQDRLTIATDVEPDAEHALVPTLILQPLVENAVRHGISRRPGTGAIDIHARRRGEELAVTVRDTGVGFADGPTREGVGLKNTRARLEQCFGDRGALTWRNHPEGGAEVTVTMPFITERESIEPFEDETVAPAAAPAPRLAAAGGR